MPLLFPRRCTCRIRSVHSLRLRLRPRLVRWSSLLKWRQAGGAVPQGPAPTPPTVQERLVLPCPHGRLVGEVPSRGRRSRRDKPIPPFLSAGRVPTTLFPFCQHVYEVWERRYHLYRGLQEFTSHSPPQACLWAVGAIIEDRGFGLPSPLVWGKKCCTDLQVFRTEA